MKKYQNFWLKILIIFFQVISLLCLISSKVIFAQDSYPLTIHVFWGEGCPHCTAAITYFEDLAEKNPDIELRLYEIYNSEINQELFKNMAELYGFEAWGVPTIFIGDYYWEGYSEFIHPEYEEVINKCLEQGCEDASVNINYQTSPQPILKSPTSTALPTKNSFSPLEGGNVETCESSKLVYWNGDMINVDGDLCTPQSGTEISYIDPPMDFELSFEVIFEQNSKILIHMRSPQYYKLELELSAQQITLTGFIFGGMVTSVERSDNLISQYINLSPGKKYQFQISHHKRLFSISIDNKLVKSSKINPIDPGINLEFINRNQFDNLRVKEVPITALGEQLPNLNGRILETFIVFKKDDYLWRIHPDGTGLEMINSTKNGVSPSFSPDGNLISFTSDRKLYLVDMKTNDIIQTWMEGIEAKEVYWTSDGNLIIIPNVTPTFQILELDPTTTEIINKHNLPKQIENIDSPITNYFIQQFSPSTRSVILKFIINKEGSKVERFAVYNLENQELNLLSTNTSAVWSLNGEKIFIPGALVDYPSMILNETDIKKINANVSPNGLYKLTNSYSVDSIDSDSFIGKANPLLNWSPDSQFITYSDNGRITVQSIKGDFLHIYEGYSPIWQPSPLEFSSNLSQNQITKTPIPIKSETPKPIQELTATSLLLPKTSTQMEKKTIDQVKEENIRQNNNSKGLIIFSIAFLILGGGLIIFSFINFGRKETIVCQFCGTINPKIYNFCGQCGKLINKSFITQSNFINIYFIIGIMSLVIGVFIMMAKIYSNSNSISHTTFKVLVTDSSKEILNEQKPNFSNDQKITIEKVEISNLCQNLDFSKDKIHDVIGKINTTLEIRSKIPTPDLSIYLTTTPDPTQESGLIEEFTDFYSIPCKLGKLSFSPDGKFILLYSTILNNDERWTTLYDANTKIPLWTRQIQTSDGKSPVWSPNKDKIGLYTYLENQNGWLFIDVDTGNDVSFIKNSDRLAGNVTGQDLELKFAWTKDDTFVRKISNAVQVIDINSNEILSEIITDDKLMGTINPETLSGNNMYEIAWSPSGDQFVTIGYWPANYGSPNSYLLARNWEAKTGNMIWELHLSMNNMIKINWSPNGGFLAISSYPYEIIEIFDVTGLPEHKRTIKNIDATSEILWSSDSSMIAGGHDLVEYTIYDLASHSEFIIQNPDGKFFTINSWLPDNRLLVSIVQEEDRLYFQEFWIISPKDNYWVELGQAKFY